MDEYKNILAAVDLSEAADMVCRRAARLAATSGAQLSILYVAEYIPPLDIAYEPITPADWMINEDDLLERATASFNKRLDGLNLGDAQRLVKLGVPKHVILQTAEDLGADVIVMGSHGRHGIGRLLGSTADSVLHSAACDVLAVRIREG